MEIFLISFVVMLLAATGLAVGMFFGRPSIKGSCGGLNLGDGAGEDCPVCGRADPCAQPDSEGDKR